MPGQLVLCGDFNCPAATTSDVDARLMDVLTSRGVLQRVDQPTYKTDNSIFSLIAESDSSNVLSSVRVIDAGFSDHYMLLTDFNTQRPVADCIRFDYRDS